MQSSREHRVLRISSRKSDLARMQAHEVGTALRAAHPELTIEFFFSESLGDKNLTDPLWKMPGKGVFTQDLTLDLEKGTTDLVVHSWKDLPVEENPRTEIAATLPRADVRDLLLFKKSSRSKLVPGAKARIYSSSPRREYNLRPFLREHLPGGIDDVVFESVRGNVPTRLRKLLEADEVDGLIVAKAAADRLLGTKADEFEEARRSVREALAACDFMVLPLGPNPAAPAQGALAVEIRRDREDLKSLLAPIHDASTFREAIEERTILKSHGGGCHQKIGATVLERENGRFLFLRGLTEAGVTLSERRWSASATGAANVIRSDLLFDRKPRPGPFSWDDFTALFVANAAAWPVGGCFPGILWTAGLSTWKKMALNGFWVNGCAEGLGEKEDPRLDRLMPGLKWATLSHGAAHGGQRGPVIATYDLVPRDNVVPPNGEMLHWTSALLFDEALRRWPELRNRRHSCGPGKTFEILKSRIDSIEIRWPAGEVT